MPFVFHPQSLLEHESDLLVDAFNDYQFSKGSSPDFAGGSSCTGRFRTFNKKPETQKGGQDLTDPPYHKSRTQTLKEPYIDGFVDPFWDCTNA